MHAADRAEVMLDEVLVEGVGAHLRVRREQPEFLARREPQQRALARADRAVARHELLDLAFGLEGDLAAMAASSVDHVSFSSAARISAASCGRTTRATSLPPFRNTSVGQSFTPNERPSRRPLASAILMWRSPGWSASAAAMSACARRQ